MRWLGLALADFDGCEGEETPSAGCAKAQAKPYIINIKAPDFKYKDDGMLKKECDGAFIMVCRWLKRNLSSGAD